MIDEENFRREEKKFQKKGKKEFWREGKSLMSDKSWIYSLMQRRREIM